MGLSTLLLSLGRNHYMMYSTSVRRTANRFWLTEWVMAEKTVIDWKQKIEKKMEEKLEKNMCFVWVPLLGSSKPKSIATHPRVPSLMGRRNVSADNSNQQWISIEWIMNEVERIKSFIFRKIKNGAFVRLYIIQTNLAKEGWRTMTKHVFNSNIKKWSRHGRNVPPLWKKWLSYSWNGRNSSF